MAHLLFIFCLLLWSTSHVHASERKKLRFTYVHGLAHGETLHKILSKAYNQQGIEIESKPTLGRRSLRLVNDGKLDGELGRVQNAGQQYPNLVIVPVPLMDLEINAYSTKPIPGIKNWTDLKNKNIGFLIGILLYDNNTKGYMKTHFHSFPDLFSSLKRGGIEIAVMEHSNYLFHQTMPLFHSKTNLHSEPLYHYVHQSHQPLVKPLSQTLEEMHKSGEIDQIYNEVKSKWKNQNKMGK